MSDDLEGGLLEVFNFKKLLEDVVYASINTPEERIDQIFSIYESFVEMVDVFDPFDIEEVNFLILNNLIEYSSQPFFPVLAGLYINSLLNKLFQTENKLEIRLQELMCLVLDKAQEEADAPEEQMKADESGNVSFSLDYLGYLMPENKELQIDGSCGEFVGALMGANSKIIIRDGMAGKYIGYEKAESAEVYIES